MPPQLRGLLAELWPALTEPHERHAGQQDGVRMMKRHLTKQSQTPCCPPSAFPTFSLSRSHYFFLLSSFLSPHFLPQVHHGMPCASHIRVRVNTAKLYTNIPPDQIPVPYSTTLTIMLLCVGLNLWGVNRIKSQKRGRLTSPVKAEK